LLRLQEVATVSKATEYTQQDVGDVYEHRHTGQRVVILSVHSCYVWHAPQQELPDDVQLQAAVGFPCLDGVDSDDVSSHQPRVFATAYRRVEA
jgi:hypothetical protein